MKTPEPLIVTDKKSGKLCLNEEMARCLASISQPLAIVSIVGKYRTGKSYLLNRLMGKQTGFPLGSTVMSETKGIWVWLRPHPYDQNRVILLMDTEGLADPDKADQNHDTSIFSLAILLSSMFVYNSKGAIDNDSINELHLTTEMTDHIRFKSSGNQAEGDFDKVSPIFVWAVRDFFLKLEKDGKKITRDEWLEGCLALKRGYSRTVLDGNSVKKGIRNFFKDRHCFTFPCPVESEKLQHLDRIHESELKEDFKAVGKEFSDFVYNYVPTKEIEGREVTGRMFVHLAYSYIEAIRRGAIPCIESAVNYMAKVENAKAQEEAINTYCKEMSKFLYPVTEDDLNKANQSAQIKSIHVFTNKAIFDQNQDFQVALGKELAEQFRSFIKKNEMESVNVCRKVIGNLYDRIEKKVKRGDYLQPGGYSSYKQDIDYLKSAYWQKPRKGVKAFQVLNEFLQDKEAERQYILAADDRLTTAQRQNEEEQARRLQAELEMEDTEKELERMERQQEEMKRNYEHGMEMYKRDLEERTEKRIENLKRTMENQQEEHERLIREGFRNEADALQSKLSTLKQEIYNSEQSKRDMRDQFERQLKAETDALSQSHQRQMEELANRLSRPPPRRKKSGCQIM